jgi:hypothetical protein
VSKRPNYFNNTRNFASPRPSQKGIENEQKALFNQPKQKNFASQRPSQKGIENEQKLLFNQPQQKRTSRHNDQVNKELKTSRNYSSINHNKKNFASQRPSQNSKTLENNKQHLFFIPKHG